MKTVKRIMTVLIMLVLLGSLLSFPASAADVTKSFTVSELEDVWLTIDSPNGEYVDDYYMLSGSLPPGMTYGINSDALILHGTPTLAGTYKSSFSVTCYYEEFIYDVTIKVTSAPPPTSVVVTPESPTPTTPDPYKDLPKITKSPTDETVDEGGSCSFIGNYENAIWAVWHFVSPDGKTDYAYDKAADEFKPVIIEGGDVSHLRLKNIPYSLNGWRVYCEYSNYAGAVRTNMATVWVNPKPTPSPSPTPTPTPTAAPSTEPTPTPAPELTISAPTTPEPTPTPTPTPTPEPARTGSNLTAILAICATVVVVAVCSTILTLKLIGRKR
jgi:hypothetical protein